MFVLCSLILLEGFVSVSLEILTIRQMIPFSGSSVIVTSIIIGIFLLFLAIGYRRGGFYTENYRTALLKNFTKAIVWIGFGMSQFFIYLFFILVEKYLSTDTLINLTLYLLVITAPIIYILGQTLPITTNLFQKEKNIGAISGKALYLSTVGSFFGAVLTSLLLLNYLGVAWAVFINVCLLAGLVVLLQDRKNINYFNLLIVGIVLLFAYQLNILIEKNFFIHTNNYANYQVVPDYRYKENSHSKALVINNSLSSILTDKLEGAAYIETIKRILFDELKLKNKEILILGAGGFTLSAASTHQNHFTYVDIDPHIYTLVKQHYLANIHGDFFAEDARQYVKKFQNFYDVIVSDAYSNRMAVPAHLLTKEHFGNIRRALKNDGFAIFNIITSPSFNNDFSIHTDNTIHSVFPRCMKIPESYKDELTNIIYVCKKHANDFDHTIYTDDLNRSTLDTFSNH
jgi:spermidine synthase